MFSSLITKHISNRQNYSVRTIGLHDVTATVGRTNADVQNLKICRRKTVILCTR